VRGGMVQRGEERQRLGHGRADRPAAADLQREPHQNRPVGRGLQGALERLLVGDRGVQGLDHAGDDCFRLHPLQVVHHPSGPRQLEQAIDNVAQPADPGTIWNFKGYMNNAWHRVHVTVQ